MGVLAKTSNISENTLKQGKNKSKIPDYARDYRNEYLFIRGIDKICGEFIERLDLERKIFNSPKANKLMLYINRFLKAQQLEYLSDTSKIKFRVKDVSFIEILELQLDDYMDLYCDPDSYEFDEVKYNNNVESDYPGFKRFFECLSRLIDKLKADYLGDYNIFDFDSDRDDKLSYLDSDSDSD